jgi:hypothetical protein
LCGDTVKSDKVYKPQEIIKQMKLLRRLDSKTRSYFLFDNRVILKQDLTSSSEPDQPTTPLRNPIYTTEKASEELREYIDNHHPIDEKGLINLIQKRLPLDTKIPNGVLVSIYRNEDQFGISRSHPIVNVKELQ